MKFEHVETGMMYALSGPSPRALPGFVTNLGNRFIIIAVGGG
jgi:hypothetical protein